MSHFVVMVLVPPSKAEQGIENAVADLLAPYDENLEVEPYPEPVSREDIDRMIEFFAGGYREVYPISDQDFEDNASPFFSDNPSYVASQLSRNMEKVEQIERQVHAYGPPSWDNRNLLSAYYKDYAGESLRFNDNGEPYCMCRYNPKSKWDWWQIGGRWTGLLTDYNPEEDIKNWETCHLCNGTGMRNDNLGIQARLEDPTYTCNGCQGKGWRVTWPTQWSTYPGDMQPVEVLLKAAEEFEPPPEEELKEQLRKHSENPWLHPEPCTHPDFVPFALVSPDGEWIEKAKMGWWAMTADEKEPDEWADQVMTTLRRYRDCYAVVVDAHI